MATRKFRKSRPRKTVRRHRTSTSGRVRVPLDVRSASDLPRFRQALKSKGLTVILVYATWCPHCHTLMPHFDAAAKSLNNTVTPVKINETMMDSVNDYIKKNVNRSAKPLSVNGYPSIILVNKNAEKITDIEPVRNTESLTKVMENSGTLANSAGLTKNTSTNNINRNAEPTEVVESIVENKVNSPKKNILTNIGVENKGMANGMKNIDVGEDELLGSIASETNKPKSINLKSMNLSKNTSTKATNKLNIKESTAPSPMEAFPENETVNVKPPSNNLKKEADAITSLQSPLTAESNIEPVSPPSPVIHELEPAEKLSGGGRGGSLMSAMARTTYTLAPAAALLATAAMVMKGRHRRTRKSTKKSRKSIRRRR